MKLKSTSTPSFNPVEFTITVESEDELRTLLALTNFCENDIAEQMYILFGKGTPPPELSYRLYLLFREAAVERNINIK